MCYATVSCQTIQTPKCWLQNRKENKGKREEEKKKRKKKKRRKAGKIWERKIVIVVGWAIKFHLY